MGVARLAWGRRRNTKPASPATIRARLKQNIGRHGGAIIAIKPPPGLWIIAAQLGQHRGEILIIDPAHPLEPGQFTARQQIEVINQAGHRGIIAIRLARLQRDAFRQVARANPGGIEALHQRQRGLGLGAVDPQFIRHLVDALRQIARIIQPLDQQPGNRHQPGVAAGGAHLRAQMFGQRGLGAAALVDPRRLAPAGTPRLPLKAALKADIGKRAGAIAGIAVPVERGAIDVERAIIRRPAFADQLVDRRAFQRGAAQVASGLDHLGDKVKTQMKLPANFHPALIGYSSGATIAYAALAQAGDARFSGAMTLGFCPDLIIHKPFCKGAGLSAGKQTKPPYSAMFNTVPAVNAPWIVLQGEIDQVCSPPDTMAFVDNVKNGKVINLPHVGHGFGVPRNWMPQYRQGLIDLRDASALARDTTLGP